MAPATFGASPQHCLALLPKLSDPDADIRYMSLDDLSTTLAKGSPNFLGHDHYASNKIIEAVIKSLDDPNGEVQNQAIKCVGALAVKLHVDSLSSFVSQIAKLKIANSVDTAIHTTALRAILAAFPPPIGGVHVSDKTLEAFSAINKTLIPLLLGGPTVPNPGQKVEYVSMLEFGSTTGVNGDAFDVMADVIRIYGPMLKDLEKQGLMSATMATINDVPTAAAVKKTAVSTMAVLAVYLPDSLFNVLATQIPKDLALKDLNPSRHRHLLSMIGALSKAVPQRLSPYLANLVPGILKVLDQAGYDHSLEQSSMGEDLDPAADELKETALVTLESLLINGSNDINSFMMEAIDAAILYIKYDPNAADDGDYDEDQMDVSPDLSNGDDANSDDNFEEDGAFSDDDDSSWKIRRCAAKVLYAIIDSKASVGVLDNGVVYGKIAPVLVKRFSEREENVRLEVINALALLVRRSGEDPMPETASVTEGELGIDQHRSRKRRRVDSNVGESSFSGLLASAPGLSSPATSPAPMLGPRMELANLSPRIISAACLVAIQPLIPAKQAALSLLRDLVTVLRGGLSHSMGNVMQPLIDIIGSSTTSSVNMSGAASLSVSLRIEALRLVASICDTHSSKLLSSYMDNLIHSISQAVQESSYKLSGEALTTLESVIKILTPPRSGGNVGRAPLLSKIHKIVIEQATSSSADLEARKVAIHALGILLARTSEGQTELLDRVKRDQAYAVLKDRLKNETTRIAAVRAIQTVLSSVADKACPSETWTREIARELTAQLRKADRTLRSSSLIALKSLVTNSATQSQLDTPSSSALVTSLLPLLDAQDIILLSSTLTIMSSLIPQQPLEVVTPHFIEAICQLIRGGIGHEASTNFLNLLQIIGHHGAGKNLMKSIINEVGVQGDHNLVGKAIGTLLVSGATSIDVTIGSFEADLRDTKEPQKQCLALSTLGEVSYRQGPQATLSPAIFTDHFGSQSESVARAAAQGLGRAGSSDVVSYLPIILQYINQGGRLQYLSLYSMKEILQNATDAKTAFASYTQQIWEALMAASQTEDNRNLGAECIGLISIVEPATFLPTLQGYLEDSNSAVRGMTIQAVRFAFGDCDEAFDEVLRPQLVSMLTLMLNDSDVENRRLALGTLSAAVAHRPETILPHLSTLLPLVMKDATPDPSLVREVQMGPFRHKVDDGLELRKSAYGTLFSLTEHSYSRMDAVEVIDRAIAGLNDEHEIKMICSLMLTKLIRLDPDGLGRRLDSLAECFQLILSHKPKDSAVKQEIEKTAESSKTVLMLTIRLRIGLPQLKGALTTDVKVQAWRLYIEWLLRDHRAAYIAAETEIKRQLA